jgi:putative pyoverdin transport system ATP-binding/permease protein
MSALRIMVTGLLRPFWAVTLLSTAAGALGGLAAAWLLATINASLHAQGGLSAMLLLRFAALCGLSVAGSAIAGVGNSIIGQKIIAALRKDIAARILHAPIAAIERQRAYRLMAVLTSDVDTVSAFTFNFAGYAVSFAIVLGSIFYLLLLSPAVFAMVLVAMGLGVAINIHAKRGWIKDYQGVREATDELQKQYRAITDGAKELRLSRARRARVHGTLLAGAADRIAALKTRAMRLFWLADSAGSAIFFAVIGLLLAAWHSFGLDASVISGTVLVLLYVKGPVEQIANGLPALAQAQISARRIATLSADFATHDALQAASATTALLGRSIELRDISYEFPGGFTLGPINLTLHRGEILFIVGENGSGKTTLIKLLLGLYTPSTGRILLDGEEVTDARRDDYRQLFSAVFSDYFLFDDLVAADADIAGEAMHYLERLEIAHKVRIEDGAFTTIDLSTGQKKRLALVHAFLEQRPVMMFDEWAADQDPTFRRVFYAELLPELKRQGKTLIVVSHDDRYFDAADRIIRLGAGHIAEDRVRNPQPTAEPL